MISASLLANYLSHFSLARKRRAIHSGLAVIQELWRPSEVKPTAAIGVGDSAL